MHTQINKRRLSPPVIAVIALLAITGISLYIRIALPYDQVFVHGAVWFRGNDAWYFMRQIENTACNFPHINPFDPYVLYPGGGGGPSLRPFFVWLVAGIAWLVGLGSPSPHIIELVGAYIPPILGTLTIIAVYFIGKELFNRWVGLLSAALLALLPGEFLNRSLLGFTDHHVLDSLLSTASMLFFILAIKRARERQISFTHLLHRDRATIAKPLIYASLAGIFLGMHFLSWKGALLIAFIVSIYLIIQFIIDHLRGKSTDYLCIIGTSYFLIASIVCLPHLGKAGVSAVFGTSLLIAVLMPIALSIISRLMVKKTVKPIYYLPALVGLAAISFAVFHAVDPTLLHSMLIRFKPFTPGGAYLTVLEMHPLLLPYGHFSLKVAWLNFTTAFFISFISLGWLIYLSIKKERADKTLFLVWSITTLAAVLGERRFGDYFAINAALLTGYFSWRILDFAGVKELLARPKQMVKAYTEAKKAKKRKKAEVKAREKALRERRIAWMKVIAIGMAVFFLVFFPNIGKAKALAQEPSLITEGWYSSLQWLKNNSPEPFGDPDFYYKPLETPFQYPKTAYGIMSWWDYGYWIMRISQRIPNSNPGQANAARVAHFFIAQDEKAANKIMDKMGSEYVIIDHQMPTTKFYAMPEWAGSNQDEFFETYYRPTQGGKLESATLFYPGYYNSTVVRLYNFDGKAAVPHETLVISYKEVIQHKEITSSKSFSNYEDAETYISSQESGNYRIVGSDPFISPVPLEEMEHYKLVYASPQKWQGKPAVKLFEYTK